jgi:hypothetical protein
MVGFETLLASTVSGFIFGEVAKANMRTHNKRIREKHQAERAILREDEERQEQVDSAIEYQESLKLEEGIRQELEKHVSEMEEELERKANEIEREHVKQTRSRARISARTLKEEEKKQIEKSKQERKLKVREK